MQVTVLQENLNKGLAMVGRAVATRPTLPITSHVLLKSDQGRLKLLATNLEIALTSWVGAKIDKEGSIAVPARILTEFIASLPNDRVELNVAEGSRQLEIRCARFQARITGQGEDEFPPIPAATDGAAAQIDADALRRAIRQVEFAAASDDTRPVLTGVNARFDGSDLTLAAADGFRLSVRAVPLTTPIDEPMTLTIPATALRELSRLLVDQEEPVGLTANATRGEICVRLKSAEMVSKLLQGTYPNYANLIPKTSTSKVTMNVADFLRAIRSAAVFARDGSGIVRLEVEPGAELTPGRLTVSARAEEVGENTTELDVLVEGEGAKIAFNSKYLSDVLSVLDTEQLSLETASPSSPGLLRPAGQGEYTHVIMPMFVQW
jgi:DNA polymerase-3 subunit beta